MRTKYSCNLIDEVISAVKSIRWRQDSWCTEMRLIEMLEEIRKINSQLREEAERCSQLEEDLELQEKENECLEEEKDKLEEQLSELKKQQKQESYEKAKEIVNEFEFEIERLYKIKVEELRKDLIEYFKNNKVAGMELKEFRLQRDYSNYYEIIPVKPCLEECYEGGNNDDINKISEKHGIKAKFIHWMYHK